MVDSKPVVSQAEELQLIIHEIISEGMHISDEFFVAAAIDKLPRGWKDFKNYLRHKRKEMGLDDLVVRLCIEEDNQNSHKRARFPLEIANIVEHSESLKKKKTSNRFGPKGGGVKKKQAKFADKCFICDKDGHKASDCKSKTKKKKEANSVEVDEDLLVAVISKLNLLTLILGDDGRILGQSVISAQTKNRSLP
ncbi:unnamed protein product [Rhodiola kirilowii]